MQKTATFGIFKFQTSSYGYWLYVQLYQHPFGMEVPNRCGNSNSYRYGFQGQEKDDEIKGEGNSYDFGARMYDSRVGRFLSMDPKSAIYNYQSPYAYALNNPIRYADLNGEGPGDRIKAAKNYKGTSYKQQSGSENRTGNSEAALKYMDCSELICRVLAADKFTIGVKSMATSDNSLQNFLKKDWEEVSTPKAGDVIIWKGHTALVTEDYVEGKKISVIHATNYTYGDKTVNGVVEEKYKLSYYQGKGAKFYSPKVDKPDGDLANAPNPTPSNNESSKKPIKNESTKDLKSQIKEIGDMVRETLKDIESKNSNQSQNQATPENKPN